MLTDMKTTTNLKRRSGKGSPILLFVVNVDWFFLSHRLPLAIAARDAGLRVAVAAADTGESKRIAAQGFDFFSIPFSRSGTGLGHEVRTLFALRRLYKTLRPDLIHHVSIKPVLYGSIVARSLGSIPVVNAVSGLGYTFTDSGRAGGIRAVTTALYGAAFSHSRSKIIFQNPDDIAQFREMGMVRDEQIVLIRGSGVDCTLFQPVPEPDGVPLVVLPSRMLWDKGVREFVEAVRILGERGVKAQFALVGGSDEGNPTAIRPEQLEAWQDEGVIEWWGHRTDMEDVFAQTSLVVLPSYREGLPKVLLEAAASGRPIVTTDVPGCREVVQHEVNGLLVPAQSVKELADAIETMVMNPKLRQEFGRRGRDMAVNKFSLDTVVDQTLSVYKKLLGNKWPQS